MNTHYAYSNLPQIIGDGGPPDECYEDSYCEKSMGIKSIKCCSDRGARSFVRSGTCNIW